MKPLTINPIQTGIFHCSDNLATFIVESVPDLLVREGIVLAVTSKIVSLAEGRLVSRQDVGKETLVRREADVFLGEIGHGCFLTIKHGLLIPSSGIDESNSERGDYILFPKDPYRSALDLWRNLRAAWGLKKLGIVITDSHTTPLRQGVVGVCLSHAGFRAVRNLVGSQDLFGRELRMTRMNLADGIAVSAVMMMGEGAECRPLAVIENAEVEFTETTDENEMRIPLEEDLYFPLLKAFRSLPVP